MRKNADRLDPRRPLLITHQRCQRPQARFPTAEDILCRNGPRCRGSRWPACRFPTPITTHLVRPRQSNHKRSSPRRRQPASFATDPALALYITVCQSYPSYNSFVSIFAPSGHTGFGCLVTSFTTTRPAQSKAPARPEDRTIWRGPHLPCKVWHRPDYRLAQPRYQPNARPAICEKGNFFMIRPPLWQCGPIHLFHTSSAWQMSPSARLWARLAEPISSMGYT